MSHVRDVVIQILAASLTSNQLFANFLSSMIVNLSALHEEGIDYISCGDFIGEMSNAISVSEYHKGIIECFENFKWALSVAIHFT